MPEAGEEVVDVVILSHDAAVVLRRAVATYALAEVAVLYVALNPSRYSSARNAKNGSVKRLSKFMDMAKKS